ncbi:hypothetical protein [Pimelobacter simplex]|uniref:hypothetical protein n=1 Tax=Nocardioides simplex TaxID=2045 RepID=UPI003AABE422
MRITRIITAFVAAFTAAMLGLTMAPSPANAAAAVAGERALPKHQLANVNAPKYPIDGRRKFLFEADAVTYKGKKVVLQRKMKGKKRWVTINKKRTNATSGHFKFTYKGFCGARYRIVLKKTASHATTKGTISRITCS